MFTLEQLVRITGDGEYGDRLESVGYNLLAAANDPRMLAHQDHQQANQVLVSFANRDWIFSGPDANVFGLDPHFGCCTANLHRGWPKLVRSLWMVDRTDEALTAVAYAPCSVQADLAGRQVQLAVTTDYPFDDETIEITVGVAEPAEFGLRLRIPGWCSDPALTIVGATLPVEPDSDGFVSVRRRWQDGDQVRLVLPMTLRTVARDHGAVGLRLGQLVEWEITPRSFWNQGLWTDDPAGIAGWPIERRPVSPSRSRQQTRRWSCAATVLSCASGRWNTARPTGYRTARPDRPADPGAAVGSVRIGPDPSRGVPDRHC